MAARLSTDCSCQKLFNHGGFPGLLSAQSVLDYEAGNPGGCVFLRDTRSTAQHITELWHCLGIVIVQARARGGQGDALWAGVANNTGPLVDIVLCVRLSMTGNTYRTGNTA